MNQKCKVCGEPAAGFHFGAFTCEGCKSFFGRTYSNVSAIGECKNGGQCVINKKNRTSCKACRLRKCLLVGMSKSGSRYGRRSNWFKIHCLLQEQTGLEAPLGAAGLGAPGSHPDLSLLNRMQHGSAGSPDGRSSDVKEEHGKHNMSSSSSVASGRSDSPIDDADEAAYKENLRMMLTGSPSESPFHLFQRKSSSSSSPKSAGLLALAGLPHSMPPHSPSFVVDPVRTSSPKSESSRKSLVLPAAHQIYQLMARQRPYPTSPPPDFRRHLSSVSPVDSIPEQDGPIDLSCKASSTSSLSSSPLGHQSVCHIRAEILADLHDDKHMDDDGHPSIRDSDTGVPLDLTTKS